jgi:hypothetical protein
MMYMFNPSDEKTGMRLSKSGYQKSLSPAFVIRFSARVPAMSTHGLYLKATEVKTPQMALPEGLVLSYERCIPATSMQHSKGFVQKRISIALVYWT